MQISQIPHVRLLKTSLPDSCHAPPNRPELELLDSTRILVERPSLLLSGTNYGQLVRSLTSKRESDRLAELGDRLAGRRADSRQCTMGASSPASQSSRDELGTVEVAAECVMLFLTCLPRYLHRSPTAAS